MRTATQKTIGLIAVLAIPPTGLFVGLGAAALLLPLAWLPTLRRWVIARRIRRVLVPPYFEKFLNIADRKSRDLAIYIQFRHEGSRPECARRMRAFHRKKHLAAYEAAKEGGK